MVVFVPEKSIKAVAVYTYIIIAYVPEKAVNGGAFKVPVDAFILMQGAPLVGVVACRT